MSCLGRPCTSCKNCQEDKNRCNCFESVALCSGCVQCIERGLSCIFADSMDKKTNIFLPEMYKTDGTVFVEVVAEVSGHVASLLSFPNESLNVVANDIGQQINEAEGIGHAVPLTPISCSCHDMTCHFYEVTLHPICGLVIKSK